MGHFIVLISMLVWRLWSNYYTAKVENQTFILYGHLSLDSLEDLTLGTVYKKGQQIATLGDSVVRDYSPHLHFQVIKNMGAKVGDYPGVCTKRWISI
jgi:murein DD-endopeptidase MepM/ murein hydrolase activator NlpD